MRKHATGRFPIAAPDTCHMMWTPTLSVASWRNHITCTGKLMSPSSSSELKPQATMRKTIRIIIGIVAAGVVLHLADLATRDCRVAPYVYDDCMWMGLRARLGLPPTASCAWRPWNVSGFCWLWFSTSPSALPFHFESQNRPHPNPLRRPFPTRLENRPGLPWALSRPWENSPRCLPDVPCGANLT